MAACRKSESSARQHANVGSHCHMHVPCSGVFVVRPKWNADCARQAPQCMGCCCLLREPEGPSRCTVMVCQFDEYGIPRAYWRTACLHHCLIPDKDIFQQSFTRITDCLMPWSHVVHLIGRSPASTGSRASVDVERACKRHLQMLCGPHMLVASTSAH